MLDWVLDDGCAAAVEAGHLDVLEWARENRCDWGVYTLLAAAEGGHLTIFQWALEHGCEHDISVSNTAARHGPLDMLQLARQHCVEWDATTCSIAAARGHLEILLCRGRMAVLGIPQRVLLRWKTDFYVYCNGLVRMDAVGIRPRVRPWPKRVIWMRYSGHVRTVAIGTLRLERLHQRMGMTMCWNRPLRIVVPQREFKAIVAWTFRVFLSFGSYRISF
jgi:hypothetical protein